MFSSVTFYKILKFCRLSSGSFSLCQNTFFQKYFGDLPSPSFRLKLGVCYSVLVCVLSGCSSPQPRLLPHPILCACVCVIIQIHANVYVIFNIASLQQFSWNGSFFLFLSILYCTILYSLIIMKEVLSKWCYGYFRGNSMNCILIFWSLYFITLFVTVYINLYPLI